MPINNLLAKLFAHEVSSIGFSENKNDLSEVAVDVVAVVAVFGMKIAVHGC
jgi:hypothetical protein